MAEQTSLNPEQMSSAALMREALGNVVLLAERQIELARVEALAQIEQERRTAIDLAAAGALALVGVIFLLLGGCLALAAAIALPAWALSLALAGVTLLGGGLAASIGWRNRARRLLPSSLHMVKREMAWLHQKTQS